MTRRGFVLWTILAALVLVGAVEAAALFEALHEQRAAVNAEAALVAQAAAVSGIAAVAAGGASPTLARLRVGDSVSAAAASLAGGDYAVTAQRVGARLYRVSAVGTDRGLGLERTVSTVLRLRPLLPAAPPAAVAVRVTPDAAVAARISGADTTVGGWQCAPPSGGGVAVRVAALAPDSTFFALGPLRWPALRAWASLGRPPDSLAVIFSPADLVLDGSRTLGTVVVDGTLTLQGGASIVGLVVATGAVVFGPGGGVILGGVITDRVGLAGAAASETRIGYSECARSLVGGLWSPLEPVPGLPWVAFR